MPGGCLGYTEAGRIQVLRNGSILYYFGNHRGGYQSQGIRLDLNRTVNLSGGRVPRGFTFGQLADVRRGAVSQDIQALANLPFRGGTGTTTFDGRQVRSSLVFNFAGRLPSGGNGTAQVQVDYLLNMDGATGTFQGGTGNTQGVATTNGQSVSITGNSTVTPR